MKGELDSIWSLKILQDWYTGSQSCAGMPFFCPHKALKTKCATQIFRRHVGWIWHLCMDTSLIINRPNGAVKCHWLLFSYALNCPSISLAPRMLMGQCPIDQAETGDTWRRRENPKEPMTSERGKDDCVDWVSKKACDDSGQEVGWRRSQRKPLRL